MASLFNNINCACYESSDDNGKIDKKACLSRTVDKNNDEIEYANPDTCCFSEIKTLSSDYKLKTETYCGAFNKKTLVDDLEKEVKECKAKLQATKEMAKAWGISVDGLDEACDKPKVDCFSNQIKVGLIALLALFF